MPLITKREIHPTAIKKAPVSSKPKVQVHSNTPSVPKAVKTSTSTAPAYYEPDFDIPCYYYNPFGGLFNLLWWLIVVIMIIAALYIAISTVFYSFMGILLFIVPKNHKCKKCGKTFKYNKNIKKCPYCATPIEEEIKAH